MMSTYALWQNFFIRQCIEDNTVDLVRNTYIPPESQIEVDIFCVKYAVSNLKILFRCLKRMYITVFSFKNI